MGDVRFCSYEQLQNVAGKVVKYRTHVSSKNVEGITSDYYAGGNFVRRDSDGNIVSVGYCGSYYYTKPDEKIKEADNGMPERIKTRKRDFNALVVALLKSYKPIHKTVSGRTTIIYFTNGNYIIRRDDHVDSLKLNGVIFYYKRRTLYDLFYPKRHRKFYKLR